MRMLITALAIISLASCKTKLICAQVNSATIKPIVLCDLSMQFNRCRCRCFNLNAWDEVEDKACKWAHDEPFKKGDYPIDYCEGIAGFYLEDIAREVKPKVKKLSKIKSDYCN